MTEIETLQDGADGGQQLPPSTKALLRTVYIMGIILVLLLIALIGGIIWKATNKAPARPAGEAAVYDLGLAPGETVTGVTLDGDRMAVTTSNGMVIVDLRKNQVTARIGFRPQ